MPNKFTFRLSNIEYFVPILVLIFILPYTYAHFFVLPYLGMFVDPINGEIGQIYSQGSLERNLSIRDTITRVGTMPWKKFTANTLKGGARISYGQQLPLTIQRNEQEFDIVWKIPETTNEEFLARIIDRWWLPYIFWITGTIVVFFVRPRDIRRLLLAAFLYLGAIWLAAGLVSGWDIWRSSSILHTSFWIIMPVALHFHWTFPRPLASPPKFWWLIYAIGFSLAIADWFHLLPSTAYLVGGLIAAIGSIVLLLLHAIVQPKHRRDVIPMAVLIGFALLPAIVLGISTLIKTSTSISVYVLITLIALPWAYLITVYRRQLGELELRHNRVVSIYIYVILLISVFVLIGVLIEPQIAKVSSITIVGFIVLAAVFSSILTLLLYTPIQRFVERFIIGIPIAPSHLLEAYSARITTSLEVKTLTQILTEEILPSMLIRQSALLRFKGNDEHQTLFIVGVTEDVLPNKWALQELLQDSDTYRYATPPNGFIDTPPWVRLSIPLIFERKLIGAWLFGRRDPDDFYSAADINTLQAIADQTAIALTNIDQADYLHALYQANIDRHENERQNLALELHDHVLSQLAIMVMNPNGDYKSDQLNQACMTIATRIRKMVNGLRPAMLSYGLRTAFDELCDSIMELSNDELVFQVELPITRIRYTPHAELHLFRIIQQACNNVLKHANAKNVKLYGQMNSDVVDLIVADDGTGFEIGQQLDLNDLLSKHHFGIVGMYERAALIGAEIDISSTPGFGTRVHVIWKPNPTQVVYVETDYLASLQEESH